MLCCLTAMSCSAAAVREFSEEKTFSIRERNAGHSRLAYFVGKNVACLFRITNAALHLAAVLYFIGN